MILAAIKTRYLGPTNYRASRVKAFAKSAAQGDLAVTLQWDYGLNATANHTRAAKALAEKLQWFGIWHGGGLDNDGEVFVRIDVSAPGLEFIAGHALDATPLAEGVFRARAPA